MGNLRNGRCLLCGKEGKLTFEHIPPQSAFNNRPINVQDFDRMMNENSYVYGKFSRMNQGFGGYTLCATCNNNTGSWYGNQFSSFAKQGMDIIFQWKELDLKNYVMAKYKIAPLNVLKQIMVMFMSADKSGYWLTQTDLVEFLLDKESQRLPERFKIYLYSAMSSFKRMLGWSLVYCGANDIRTWSEINFQPFGYFLTENSLPPEIDMYDISYFSNYKLDQEVNIFLRTPFYKIESPIIGQYS